MYINNQEENTIQKFLFFLGTKFYAHQCYIYLIKNCEIILHSFLCKYIFKYNLFLWYKAEFSASLLHHMSHDHSEIILICLFGAQKIFLIIINVENCCAASYFCRNYRVNVPIKLIKIYIETFLVHKILVSVQKVMLKY